VKGSQLGMVSHTWKIFHPFKCKQTVKTHPKQWDTIFQIMGPQNVSKPNAKWQYLDPEPDLRKHQKARFSVSRTDQCFNARKICKKVIIAGKGGLLPLCPLLLKNILSGCALLVPQQIQRCGGSSKLD